MQITKATSGAPSYVNQSPFIPCAMLKYLLMALQPNTKDFLGIYEVGSGVQFQLQLQNRRGNK